MANKPTNQNLNWRAKMAAKKQTPEGEVTATKTKVTSRTTSKDKIADAVKVIENYSEDQAHKALLNKINNRDNEAFEIGGVLSLVQRNNWFKGYANLKEYCANEFGLDYRKAMYYIGIYNNLLDSGVSWDSVKHLGWTKLSRLSQVMTKDNAAEWIEKAKNMTVVALEQAIKGNKSSSAPADSSGIKSETTSLTFKLHKDQAETVREALAKAKGELQTEYDTVAIENICMGYLTGSVQAAAPAKAELPQEVTEDILVELFKKSSPELVFAAFEKVWPHINVSVEE